MIPSAAQSRIHLRAFAYALGILSLTLGAAWATCIHLEHRCIDALLVQPRFIKDTSLALQRAALREPDVLPLHGTSELQIEAPARAGDYFAPRPSGFAVEPLGYPGATSLIMAERLAALAPEMRGRRMAVLISPSFFHIMWNRSRAYARNFSPLLAGECLYSSSLSRPLRQRFAERMGAFPETLRRRPMLEQAALHLQNPSVTARLGDELLAPLGRAQNLLYAFQDHAAVFEFLQAHEAELPIPVRTPKALDWLEERRRYAALARPFPDPHPTDAHKHEFHELSATGQWRHSLLHNPEWDDFDLLLDTAHELHVQLLVLVIPLNGVYLDELGVPRDDRAFFYDRLEGVCAHHHAVMRDFREWDEDPAFFLDTHDHLTSKGWILIDQTLDDFYHNRPIAPPRGKIEPATQNPPAVKAPARLS